MAFLSHWIQLYLKSNLLSDFSVVWGILVLLHPEQASVQDCGYEKVCELRKYFLRLYHWDSLGSLLVPQYLRTLPLSGYFESFNKYSFFFSPPLATEGLGPTPPPHPHPVPTPSLARGGRARSPRAHLSKYSWANLHFTLSCLELSCIYKKCR